MEGIANVNAAFGQNATDSVTRTFERKTSAAVSAKVVVSSGTTGLVATSATDGTASLCVGFTTHSAASGDTVQIAQNGEIVTGVGATGTIAAGDVVKRSTTTAGSVSATASPAAGEALGTAIAASASNTVSILVARSL